MLSPDLRLAAPGFDTSVPHFQLCLQSGVLGGLDGALPGGGCGLRLARALQQVRVRGMQRGIVAQGTGGEDRLQDRDGRAEFDLDLPARASLVATDSPAQLAAFEPPAVLADFPAVPLGAILAGEHPGRSSPDDVTLYASVGLAGTEPYLLAHLLGLDRPSG